MGIFSSIKNAIFGGDEEEAKTKDAGSSAGAAIGAAAAAATSKPAAISEVDVAANLDARPGADKLNWRTSIVDLMKLLGLDPSFANRKELAAELGDTDYSGTAEENIWLHKKTMQEIAKNGGKVPAEFRD